MTSHPSLANICAAERPIPESPPVTIADLPLSLLDPSYCFVSEHCDGRDAKLMS